MSLGDQELKLAVVVPTLPSGRTINHLLNVNIRDLPDEEVVKKFQATLAEIKLKDPRFIGVVPSRWAITRNIEIPSRDPQEIREIVNLQASRHTPYSRSEIVVDYLNLGVFKSVYTKILLIIAPRTSVTRFYDILGKSSLSLDRIVFAPEAVARSLSKRLHLDAEKLPSCIVRVDAATSDFMIVSKGNLLFVRNLPVGASHFAEDKQNQLIRFLEELKQSFETYRNENIEQDPVTLFLTGAAGGMDNVEQMIEEILKLTVKRLVEGEGLPIHGEAKPSPAEQTVSFLDVISPPLLLEELSLDLTPEENKLKRSLEERTKEIIKAGILSMICFGLICFIFLMELIIRKAEILELKRRYGPIQIEAKTLEDAYVQIQAVRSYLKSRGKSMESLAELYDLIPDDIFLNDIRFEEGEKFSIKGSATSRPSIFAFVGAMEDSKLFRNVQTKYVTGRKEEGKELADFEIVASFEK